MSDADPSTRRKYRMLFKNGEMIVSGYDLRKSDKETLCSYPTRMMVPRNKLQDPLPTTFHYLDIAFEISPEQTHPIDGPLVLICSRPREYSQCGTFAQNILRWFPLAITKIRNRIYRGSPDEKAFRRSASGRNSYINLIESCYSDVSTFLSRSIQVLQFHAHTIQLLFRRNVERKRTERASAIDYLLEQQKQILYLQNEYVLRNIFAFAK
jgi:hypothetical protein